MFMMAAWLYLLLRSECRVEVLGIHEVAEWTTDAFLYEPECLQSKQEHTKE